MKSALLFAVATAVTAATVFGSGPVLAQATSNPKPDFQQVKQRRLAQIDALRACIEKATDGAAMKACKPQRK